MGIQDHSPFGSLQKKLDLNGFVVDFSSLKPLENRLKEQFDHTFLVNKDDPLLNYWEKLHDLDALDLRIMDNVGMEFTSELIWRWANEYLQEKDKGCLLYTSPSPRDTAISRMPSSA